MTEQAEPKFVVAGTEYPVPAWESFTIDESELLYDRAKMTVDQIDDEVRMTPSLIAALLTVAYMRANPTVPRAKAEKYVGGLNLMELLQNLRVGEDDAEVPPSVQPTPDEPESSSDSTTSSGDDSATGSENSAVLRLRTGTSGSDMSHTSDPMTSAG